VVCAQVEPPKCGTKEGFTRNIACKVNSVLNKLVFGRCAQEELQEKSTREIATKVDVDCKISSAASRNEHVKASLKELSIFEDRMWTSDPSPKLCGKQPRDSSGS
jgi:hypothetical protein